MKTIISFLQEIFMIVLLFAIVTTGILLSLFGLDLIFRALDGVMR